MLYAVLKFKVQLCYTFLWQSHIKRLMSINTKANICLKELQKSMVLA